MREQSDPGCPRNEDNFPEDDNCGIIRDAFEKYLNEENGLCSENRFLFSCFVVAHGGMSVCYEFIFSLHIKDERYLFIYYPDEVELECAELVDDPEDNQPICDSEKSLQQKIPKEASL